MNRLALHFGTQEHRGDAKFARLVNQHDEIMTENLSQRFVDLRDFRLATERVTEFPLDHAERGSQHSTACGSAP